MLDRSAGRRHDRPAPAPHWPTRCPLCRRDRSCRVRGLLHRPGRRARLRVLSRSAPAQADLLPPFEERQMEERKHLLSTKRLRRQAAAAAAAGAAALIYSHRGVISHLFFGPKHSAIPMAYHFLLFIKMMENVKCCSSSCIKNRRDVWVFFFTIELCSPAKPAQINYENGNCFTPANRLKQFPYPIRCHQQGLAVVAMQGIYLIFLH